jgi:hypothetical protein
MIAQKGLRHEPKELTINNLYYDVTGIKELEDIVEQQSQELELFRGKVRNQRKMQMAAYF